MTGPSLIAQPTVLHHAYQMARRALEQKRRDTRLMLQPGPTVIELVVRREIAR